MSQTTETYRTNDQLEALLYETGNWAVYGQQGRVLCLAASLHRAIQRTALYAFSGAVVTAVCRLPPNGITVMPTQLAMLRDFARATELVDNDHASISVLSDWTEANLISISSRQNR
jgi:hypothetical protein